MKKIKKLFSLLAITSMCLLISVSTIRTTYAEENSIIIDFYGLPIETGIYRWQENNGIYLIYNPNIPSSTFANSTLLEFYNSANEDLTPLTNSVLTVGYLRNGGTTTSTAITDLKDEIEYIMTHAEAFLAEYEVIEIIDIQQTIFDDSLFESDFVTKIEVKPSSHISITYDVSSSSTLNNIDDMFEMLTNYRNNIEDYWLNFGGDYTQGYNDGYLIGGNRAYNEARSEYGIYINGNWLTADEYSNMVADGLQEQIDDLQQQLDDFEYGSTDYFLFEFGKWITPVIAIVIFGGGLFMFITRKREV